ncbi:glycosyltransferase family 2 protein [Ralstonia solanacearum]|uniref:glycosyltransferase family 2 protein n=1 Tax=Ralstonia solanacearum TaxID=305 RepID=UPI0005C614BC|nr:glycosyltransferase family 2 protein [Ralstonia solanacearum]MDB0542252.1 glycosyltransferase family 2 protein [Ralstonia solanacearum]MDB0552476.1 glycosyltransferase family 2 protein [Ralstonia solanacearum]MDB0557216.1 glycosyltransferase family 2 protein [Ralstonia solanacearum]
MLRELLQLLCAAGLALLLPGALYLLLLSVAALLLARHARPQPTAATADRPERLAIIVPAHNEAAGIGETVAALCMLARADAHCEVVVVADNCDDDTASRAATAGARVLVRHAPQSRGKGQALAFAFARLRRADWYLVVDADSRLDPGFLPAQRRAIATGADALQARYLAHEDGGPRSALAQLAWFGWNLVRPLGRARLGLSAGILGNGFSLSRRTLARVPYDAASIVEDAEYHLRLVRAGLRVRWVDDATVRAAPPPDRAAAAAQRTRWIGGRLALLRAELPAVLRDLLLGPAQGSRAAMADLACDLLLPPLSLLVTATLALSALSALLAATSSGPLALVGAAVIGAVAFHVFAALRVGQAQARHWLALLRLPGHLLWSLVLLPRTLRAARSGAQWVRTPRRHAELRETPHVD